jgi:hypothetical protein
VHLLVSLVGADGTALAARSIAILPGESAHLRLRGPSDRAGRLLVRAAISIPPPDDQVPPPDDGTPRPTTPFPRPTTAFPRPTTN